ncbi:MAG: hypothetical protein ACFBSC_00100 [Microcoleaceae cyanobacterium]
MAHPRRMYILYRSASNRGFTVLEQRIAHSWIRFLHLRCPQRQHSMI